VHDPEPKVQLIFFARWFSIEKLKRKWNEKI
jgi:hypothetical protein